MMMRDGTTSRRQQGSAFVAEKHMRVQVGGALPRGQTRDTEIIPALKSGKKDAAKALAKGVQAERVKKLNELLGSLGAK